MILTRHRFPKKVATVAALSVLAGCAAISFEGRYPYDDGWRKAVITSLDPDRAGHPPTVIEKDCRGEFGSSAQVRFVRVHYPEARNLHSRIVAIPIESGLRAGDSVYIKKTDCKTTAVSAHQLN